MATATRRPKSADVASAIRELVQSFGERKLFVWASALSFQIIKAMVPFLLFALGLLGFLDLQGAWTDIAKNIKPHMSSAAFNVVDSTAKQVLTSKQVFWVTAGFALAVWWMSAGIRTIMGGLSLIFDMEDTRSWKERMGTSILLAIAVGFLVIGATAIVWLGPLLYGDVGQPLGALFFLVRWIIAASLLGLAVGLTVRYGPDSDQPAEWVSIGTAIVVLSWSLTSILFGLYIRYVASYGSIFGNLATVVVLFIYVYLSSIVFFAGVQVDAIIRRRVEGNPQGR
ncbi:MAG: YihY/virulence factor BrkB family protein [Thermoleophilaceae bacterium]